MRLYGRPDTRGAIADPTRVSSRGARSGEVDSGRRTRGWRTAGFREPTRLTCAYGALGLDATCDGVLAADTVLLGVGDGEADGDSDGSGSGGRGACVGVGPGQGSGRGPENAGPPSLISQDLHFARVWCAIAAVLG